MDIELKDIKEFREGILNGGTSKDKCFMVSSPLSSYMQFLGYECELTSGSVLVDTLSEIGEMSDYEHFWITLSDGTIIDATADQFVKPDGGKMPEVYIGVLPDWYMAEDSYSIVR